MRPRQGPRAPEGARRGGPKGGGVRSKSGLQLLGIALVALALALLPALPAEFWGPIRPSRPALGSAGTGTAAVQPNIIVIQTDDQNPASLTPQTMPNVLRDIAGKGTTFTDYIDSGPLCCPSRAVLLTGQYGHNNGVMWNNPAYADLREKDNTLPVWLQQAGYVTAHVGKYLNLYGLATGDPNQVAPGWDQWDTVLEPVGGPHPLAPTPYYDYVLRVNGDAVQYGSAPSDYLTDVLNNKAVALIHRDLPGPKPLFMAVDQAAPHTGANSDPRCHGTALPAPADLDAFRRRTAPDAALIQRGRRERQAEVRSNATAAGPGGDQQLEAHPELQAGIASGRRSRRRAHRQRTRRGAPAREHGDLLHLRQRLPARRAPPGREGRSLRGGPARSLHRSAPPEIPRARRRSP